MATTAAEPEVDPINSLNADTHKGINSMQGDVEYELSADQKKLIVEMVESRIASNRTILKQTLEVRAVKSKTGRWYLPRFADIELALAKEKPSLKDNMREHQLDPGRAILITTKKDIPPSWKKVRVVPFTVLGEDLSAPIDWLPEAAKQVACRVIVQVPGLTKEALVERFAHTLDGFVAIQRIYRGNCPSYEYELLFHTCPAQLAGRDALTFKDDGGMEHNFMLLKWTVRSKCTMCNSKGHEVRHCFLRKLQKKPSYAEAAGVFAEPPPSNSNDTHTHADNNNLERRRKAEKDDEEIPLKRKQKSSKSNPKNPAPHQGATAGKSVVLDPTSNPTPAEAKNMSKAAGKKGKPGGGVKISPLFNSPRTKTPPRRKRDRTKPPSSANEAPSAAEPEPPAPFMAPAPDAAALDLPPLGMDKADEDNSFLLQIPFKNRTDDKEMVEEISEGTSNPPPKPSTMPTLATTLVEPLSTTDASPTVPELIPPARAPADKIGESNSPPLPPPTTPVPANGPTVTFSARGTTTLEARTNPSVRATAGRLVSRPPGTMANGLLIKPVPDLDPIVAPSNVGSSLPPPTHPPKPEMVHSSPVPPPRVATPNKSLFQNILDRAKGMSNRPAPQ